MRFRSIQSAAEWAFITDAATSRNPYEIQVNTKQLSYPNCNKPPNGFSRNPYEIQVNTKVRKTRGSKAYTFDVS